MARKLAFDFGELYQLAERHHETESLEKNLAFLADFQKKDRNFSYLFQTFTLSIAEKKRVLQQVLPQKMGVIAWGLIDMLLLARSSALFLTLQKGYEQMVCEKKNKLRAQVLSAFPIPPDFLKKVHSQLEKNVGKKIELQFCQDPSLIEGVVVQLGIFGTFDFSYKSQLQKLKTSLQQKG